MTLRDKIAKTLVDVNWDSDGLGAIADEAMADAILALPEMKEMMEKAEKYDNAMAQTKYCEDCKAPILEQQVLQAEIEGWKEKADKWDKRAEDAGKLMTRYLELAKKEVQLSLIINGLEVEVPCNHEPAGMPWICGRCNRDIGWRGSVGNSISVTDAPQFFTRPATPEEVREMLKGISTFGGWEFPSGAVMRIKQ